MCWYLFAWLISSWACAHGHWQLVRQISECEWKSWPSATRIVVNPTETNYDLFFFTPITRWLLLSILCTLWGLPNKLLSLCFQLVAQMNECLLKILNYIELRLASTLHLNSVVILCVFLLIFFTLLIFTCCLFNLYLFIVWGTICNSISSSLSSCETFIRAIGKDLPMYLTY